MTQDASCKAAVKDNSTSSSKQMLEVEYHTSSSSKKLKSFHFVDDKTVEHTMKHGNASIKEQQGVAANSKGKFSESKHELGIQLNERSLLAIEACAGTATLCSVLKDMGFDVLPIDFGKQRNTSHLHIINLDLRQKHSWDFLTKVALSHQLFHFHGAPPCGTASRAREIALDSSHHGPPQWRSEEFPLGFPWLQVGCIENPGNSYRGMIDLFRQLQKFGFWVFFHVCCHGSLRKKLTAFLTNVVELTGLAATCQGDHPHEAWGLIGDCGSWSFATSKEAAYPVQLCQRFGTLLEMRALSMGFQLKSSDISALHKVRASVGSQVATKDFEIPNIDL